MLNHYKLQQSIQQTLEICEFIENSLDCLFNNRYEHLERNQETSLTGGGCTCMGHFLPSMTQ